MEIYEDWLDCIHVVHLPPVTDSKLEVKPPLMSPPPPQKRGGAGNFEHRGGGVGRAF